MKRVRLSIFMTVFLNLYLIAATQVTSYDSDLHDRFDSSSFIADGFDLSGIARSSDTRARWATMIAPDYFISANHYKPSNGSTLTFHLDNDSVGPTISRTVDSGVRIGSTDIWIGKLTSPVPGSVKIYGLATTSVDLSSDLGIYEDQLVYQVGLRASQDTGGTTNFLVGLNNIEIGDSTSVALGTYGVIGYVRDEIGDTNLHDPGETFLQAGDSGAPSFILDGGELKLVGIHSYILNNLTDSAINFSDFVESQSTNSPFNQLGFQTRDVAYDAFVPNYSTAIYAVIPELRSLTLIGILFLGSGVTLLKKRKTKSRLR